MTYTTKEKEILATIDEIASRYFTLNYYIEYGIPLQDEQEDLYTLEEVSKILALSIVTVRQYVRSGRMKAIKQWKNWMVTSNEVAKVKYERQHGVKLPDEECMLALVAGELNEDNSQIESYVLCTAKDLLEQIDEPASAKIYGYLDRVFASYKGPCTYIESITSIPNFFKRTKDIPYSDTLTSTDQIQSLFAETDDTLITEELTERIDELVQQEPAEALEFIEKTIGDPADRRTLLHVYSLLLYEIKNR